MEHLDDSMDVFTSLLKASDECIEMMSTDVMRAAIAFKWQAFGRTMWLEQLVVLVIFFFTYIPGVYCILRGPY